MYRLRKKNIPSIEKEMMNATMFVPRKVGARKKLKSIIGTGTRRSTAAKKAMPSAASANRPRIRGEPQPQALASTSASTSAVRPSVMTLMPAMSTFGTTVSSRDSLAANSVTTIAPAATGRLMKKIDCQETCSTSTPPSTGPIASASAETPAQVPIACPRSCGGNVFVMIDSVAGIISAAPMPWAARPPISHAEDCEKPMNRLEAAKIDDADEKDAPAAEDVAEPPAGDEQHAEGEHVGVDRPFQAARPRCAGRAGSTAARR